MKGRGIGMMVVVVQDKEVMSWQCSRIPVSICDALTQN